MGKYRGIQTWGNTGGYRHGEIQEDTGIGKYRGIQASKNTGGIGSKLYRIQTSGNTEK